jgi:amino acid adenylation domain-containing protein
VSALLDAPVLRGGCHQAFERQAAATPNAIAIAFEGGELGYGELNRRANRLARLLRASGARRGCFVGIHLERSAEMVVAVLAVLKSGAAYLPLDPAYPAARLRHMLDDAAPAVLVTTSLLAVSLPQHPARTLLIEQALAGSAHDHDHDPATDVSAGDVAYLMYTSGSTGRPKGVLVTHGGVANYLAWRHSYFPLRPADRVLQKSSLSFDDSVWEILEPLSAGAIVVLARPRFEFDSAYLVELMALQRISAACFVPSLLAAIIDQPGLSDCSSLRRLTTGGELLPVALQQRVLERLPGAALYNGYGTTETTIASTFWKCVTLPGQSSVPIGRPIAHTQVYVLDADRQPLPAGNEGEIYIGGAGVARGYLNLPTLTAERFVDDPLGGTPGKMYRTGDLGKLRSDGVLEFIGRADAQVKLRGVRIELGDIEAALAEHPGVRAAAAACIETAEGTRLIAGIVAHDLPPPPSAELRAFLSARLPASMIPNRIAAINALPLSPSGKLDRQQLATLVGAALQDGHYLAPRDDLEQLLTAIWQPMLKGGPIGRNQDFFALGGDSLTAVAIAAAMSKAFARPFPPGLLFEHPSIERLAARVRAGSGREPRAVLVPLAAGGAARPLFLVHQVDGDVFRYRELARALAGERPVYGLRAPGLDDGATPHESIEAMAAHYVREIRAVQARGPYAIAGHSSGGLVALEMAQQLHAVAERVEPLGIIDINARTRHGRSLADAVRWRIAELRSLPRAERWRYLNNNLAHWSASACRRLRRAPPAPIQVRHPDLSAVQLAMERAIAAYEPRRYPGFITVFRATDRRLTGTYERTLGWRALAGGGIRVIGIQGDHGTILKGDGAHRLAAALRECLDG